jgi:aquaporin related protein
VRSYQLSLASRQPFGELIFRISCPALQLLGGIVAAALIYALTPGQLNVRTTLAPGMNKAQGLFLEVSSPYLVPTAETGNVLIRFDLSFASARQMFLTALLVTTILLLAVKKHRSTYLAPYVSLDSLSRPCLTY